MHHQTETLAALPTDLPDILEILEEINLDMEDLHYSQFLVQKVKGEVVAAGRIRVHEDGTRELCSLGVLEEHRGQGRGKTLISRLLEMAGGGIVYLVTEAPEYFSHCGFQTAVSFPEVLNDKLRRCAQEYACSNPQVMQAGT